MPAVPSCPLEPIWVEFSAAVGDDPPEFDSSHPLGRHRRRITNRAVFEHIIDALVHGSPMDRGQGGLKRSVATEGAGIPLGIVSAGANRHDSPLLEPTLTAAQAQVGPMPEQVTSHLDAGYDSDVTRDLLAQLGFDGEISRKGVPAPIQVGKRWVVERVHSWMNGYGKLRRRTDKDGDIVDFYLYLAAALVTVRQLIQRARNRYRWEGRPTTRRLK